MKTPTTPDATNVIKLMPPPKKSTRRAEDKWTPQVLKHGYTPLPNLLMRAQAKLKIDPAQFNVLVHLAEHWWDSDKDPFPAKDKIAQRMRKSPRQVQRYITQLEEKGLVKRRPRFLGKNAQTSNAYSLDGLVKKLLALEPEFKKASDLAKQKLKKVEAASA